MNNKITTYEYGTLSFFLINSFLMNTGYEFLIKYSKNDSIIDILLGGIFILIISFIIYKIHNNSNKNIIDRINKYPIFIKYLIYLVLFISIFISIIYTLSNLIFFINYYILKEISIFIITITLIITVLYIADKGINTITKLSEIFFYIYILFFLIGFIGLIKYIDISNIKPLFTTNYKNHLLSSGYYIISSIIPLFLLLIIPKEKVNWTIKNKKYPFYLIITSIILTFIQLIILISVLGIKLTSIYKYPEMIALKKISFLNLLERLEVFLSLNNILNSIFFIIMGIYFEKEIINKFIDKKKEHITLFIIGIILFFLCSFINIKINIYLILNILILILLLLFFVHYLSHKHKNY